MLNTSVSLVYPLSDASTVRSAGCKAARLACLRSSTFPTPKGFVVSADAFRLHMWKSGARSLVLSADENTDYESIRRTILDADVPQEIAEAVQSGYRTLGLHIGFQSPKVLVRPSPVEETEDLAPVRGIYDHCGPISGVEQVLEAIKTVWASVWSEQAVSHWRSIGEETAPSMAVLVHDAIDCRISGTVETAERETGDTYSAVVYYRTEESDEIPARSVFRLDRLEFTDLQADNIVRDVLETAVDKSIMLEQDLNCLLRVEWGWDGRYMWIFQVEPLGPVPLNFPGANLTYPHKLALVGSSVNGRMFRPVSGEKYDGLGKILLAMNTPEPARVVGGHIYRPVFDELDSEKIEQASSGALNKAQDFLKHSFIQLDSKKYDSAYLSNMIRTNESHRHGLVAWMTAASAACWGLRNRLKSALEDMEMDSLLFPLLSGIASPFILRDAKLQDFGARLLAAQMENKLESASWWNPFNQDVQEFAREYGYSFTNPAEYYNPALWTSWVEDTQQVFRIIKALAVKTSRPSIPALQVECESSFSDAMGSINSIQDTRVSKRLVNLIELTRQWISCRYEMEHKAALISTQQRLAIREMAKLILPEKTRMEWQELMELDLAVLCGLASKPADQRTHLLITELAKAKHARWLESRLIAPEYLGPEEESDVEMQDELSAHGKHPCVCMDTGKVVASIRTVDDYEKASDVCQNDVIVVDYPALSWSSVGSVSAGIVAEHPGDVPIEAHMYTQYRICAAYACKGILKAVSSSRKLQLDTSEAYAQPL